MSQSNQDRTSELDAFKKLNLSAIACDHGYSIVKSKSTRHSVLMESGNDKIIVSKNGEHYVYCSVTDQSSNGTVVDFAANVIERGASLGRVRQLLRPYLNGQYFADVSKKHDGRFAKTVSPSRTDFQSVAVRFAGFQTVSDYNPFLNGIRGIPLSLMLEERVKGRVFCCPEKNTIVFPHYGSPNDDASNQERCLNGYEIKGQGVTMFSKAGRKGLWASAGFNHDKCLAVTESGLDALSYLALKKRSDMRTISVAGQINPFQPELIRSAINRMEEGSQIVAAFDNDEAGDRMTETLAKLVLECRRSNLEFAEDRPLQRGADWNDVLRENVNANSCSVAANSL